MQVTPLLCWMPKREALDLKVCSTTTGVGRVSITGLGMRSSPQIFCTFLKALSDADVELDLVDISETSVGAVTHADRLADAERAVRRAFGMTPVGRGNRRPVIEGHLTPAVGPPLQTWVPISCDDMTPVPAGRQNCGTSLLAKELKDGQDREDRKRPHQTSRVAGNPCR